MSRIAIDIGHAQGTGARGNGLEEHAVCEVLARLLKVELTRAGHVVGVFDFPDLTNGEDLRRTVSAVNGGAWDCGLSLHCDCADSPAACGAHVCFFSAAGRRLAEEVAGPLCDLLPGRAQRVVRRGDLYILKATRPVWVLCECGFISNARDAVLLRDSPERVAAALASAFASKSFNC